MVAEATLTMAMHTPSVAPPPKSRSFKKPTKKGPRPAPSRVTPQSAMDIVCPLVRSGTVS